jgi:hypothetical protein
MRLQRRKECAFYMSNELKTIVEKYCPVVGRNVAVELSGFKGSASCLNDHTCQKEYGGCKNKLFPGVQENS